MKVLKVNQNCNGCGLCIVNCKYLQENSDGNAEFVPGTFVEEQDYEDVKKVVGECPCNALQLVEEGTTKKGDDGVREVIEKFKKQVDEISVKRKGDLKFSAKNYSIEIPYSSKEYTRYSSESQARSAARDDFRRLCYSESAYRPIIKGIFVEYKVNVLKPYYDCKDEEGNIYYTYNQQARELLAKTYAELNSLVGKKISTSWKEFSSYLSSNDMAISVLENFDARSTNSGIIAALKDLSNTSLDNYVSEMDFDYDEIYEGTGLFGGTKCKKQWYFTGFYSAASSYIDDLKWAIDYQSSDIQDAAKELVDHALNKFETELKKQLMQKIAEVEKILL